MLVCQNLIASFPRLELFGNWSILLLKLMLL
uniref:Uncharacterized protein n=1 Tax=Rhizophora mucronata TaxID=61149 RepID=A0A2P2QWB3_RHIMU